MSFLRIKTILNVVFLVLAASLILSSLAAARPKEKVLQLNDPKALKTVLARIGDEPVTVKDLVDFAKSSPAFYGFLEIPGGPDKLLKELVLERLLLLEGKAQNIPEPANHNQSLYLLKIKKKLLPPLPPVTEKEAQEYYKEHILEFSTPLYLRLSQIKVYFNEKTRGKALKKIEEAQKALKKGASFDEVVRKYSEEPISRERGGDIGFIPSSSVGSKEVLDKILKLKKGETSGILVIGNSYTIVKLTDRREPISDPYERVKGLAKQKAAQAREKARLERLRKRLEEKYHVIYMDH